MKKKHKKRLLYILTCLICVGSIGYGCISYNIKLDKTVNDAKKELQQEDGLQVVKK